MTTNKEVEEFSKKAEEVRKEVSKSKSEARKLLVATGMYNKRGKLKREFDWESVNLRGYSQMSAILDDDDYERPIEIKKKFKIFPLPLQWWVNDSYGKNMYKTTWLNVLTGKHIGQKLYLGRP